MDNPHDQARDQLRERVRSYAERMRDSNYRAVYGIRFANRSVNGRLIFGVIVVTLGVLWTLDNLGLIDSDEILRFWPAILIAFGLAKLFGWGTRRNPVWGATFAIAGTWWLAGTLDIIHAHLFSVWPLILIAIGVTILLRPAGPRAAGGDDVQDRISTFAMWSGVGRKVLSRQFVGGDVSAVMGGAEIDLRGAQPVEGGAVIDLFVWWGGVDLVVPESWRVINEATALMGGIEDRTKTPPPDAQHTLILRGVIIMGGVEIKH